MQDLAGTIIGNVIFVIIILTIVAFCGSELMPEKPKSEAFLILLGMLSFIGIIITLTMNITAMCINYGG